MREIRTYGSVRGASRKARPYRDRPHAHRGRFCKTRRFCDARSHFFNARSQMLLSSGAPATRKNSVSRSQCFSRYEIAPPSDEFGSTSRPSNCRPSQM